MPPASVQLNVSKPKPILSRVVVVESKRVIFNGTHLIKSDHRTNTLTPWAPSQYKDRLICVWRFPC